MNAAPNKYDLLLKGGNVVDPGQGILARRDVAFSNGKVAAVQQDIPGDDAAQIMDAEGKLVVPGLIDLHGHFAHKITPYRADPDATCLPFGVTTAVDTGSTGWINFAGFRAYVIDRVDTRLFAFLHLSSLGVSTVLTLGIPDTEDFRLANEEEAVRCIRDNGDIILGIKVRLSPMGTTLANAIPSMEMARRVADRTGTRIMVHVMETPLTLAQVFTYLHSGDVVTHIFHGEEHNVLAAKGKVRPEVWEAQRAGIVFDTGCFMRHFSIPICKSGIEQGLLPDTLSTDIVGQRPGSISYNLLDIMSMFIGLGMTLDQVIGCVTANPAKVLDRPDLGNLRVGSVGDAAVLEIEDGDFKYEDQLGHDIRLSSRFAHVSTIKDGAIWAPGHRQLLAI